MTSCCSGEQGGKFGGDALEDAVNERVHDAHSFSGDTIVRENLPQHFVDVDRIAFLYLYPSTLLLSISRGLCLTGFLPPFCPATLAAMSADYNGFE